MTSDLNEESLREAGIQNCDVVIVCIGENMGVGILTTMTVIDMGVPRVISKALTTEQGAVLKKLGAGGGVGRLPGEGYGLSAREETCL